MQAELEQTYPRLGTIYSLCSVYYPNIRQRSDVLNRRNFLKPGFYEGIMLPWWNGRALTPENSSDAREVDGPLVSPWLARHHSPGRNSTA